MKGKMKLILTAAALIITLLAASACAKKLDAEILKNISELTVNIYTARTETAAVTLITGERETPYKVDGINAGRETYTVVFVKPLTNDEGDTVYEYVLRNGKNEYSGRLNAHPFGTGYTDTVEKSLDGGVSMTIICNGVSAEVTPEPNYKDGMMTWENALIKSVSELKPELNELYTDGKLNAEVFVRFTGDPMQKEGGYFWYVAFCAGNGRTLAVLIKPETGDVVASKK